MNFQCLSSGGFGLACETLLLDVPHRQIVFTIPKRLRVFFKFDRRLPAKGWAEMIRKVYEVDPMTCPKCGGRMKVVAFLTEYAVVDRIIDHLKLTFVAAKPPPSHVFTEVALPEAEESGAYC